MTTSTIERRDLVAPRPRLVGVATATPDTAYSQQEILTQLQCTDRRVSSLFLRSAIDRRFLSLPRAHADAGSAESQGQLLRRHGEVGIDIGGKALKSCL